MTRALDTGGDADSLFDAGKTLEGRSEEQRIQFLGGEEYRIASNRGITNAAVNVFLSLDLLTRKKP